MPWRIRFTADDLERIQIGQTLGPVAETFLALSLLRRPARPRGALRRWPDDVKDRVTPAMKPLIALIPPDSAGVDLFALTGGATTIERGLIALMSAPDDEVAAELEHFDRFWKRLPASAYAVAEGGGRGRVMLAAATVSAYQGLVAPYWAAMVAGMRAEQALRRRILASAGGSAVLASLRSRSIRWTPPYLEVDTPTADVDHEFELCGHGIVLIPSPFTADYPTVHMDLARPGALSLVFGATTLTAVAPVRPLPPGQRVRPELAPLLGRTRAAALAAIADGCTTSELAQLLGISAAGASQHATVLREAGLIVTHRHAGSALHTLTPLGAELLAGGLSQG